MRDLATLPKAHLHLHFTGSMRLETLIELASSARTRLPSNFLDGDPLRVPADRRGWFRFQRAYDTARALVRTEEVMRRIVLEAALDDASEGSRRLEIQVDPTSYAPFVGGITPALEIILDAAKQATTLSRVEVAVIVAASRMRHPLDARTLARLAVRYAGDQPGEVIGFGLSNDERAGQTSSWERAFAIARRGGLASMPHGGELLGPDHLREVVSCLGPTRLGHGVRAGEDPALLDAIVASGISLEVCPASNVSLGVYHSPDDVPLRRLMSHGAQIALSADDPLLFQSRLVDQYEIARALGCGDAELAELARGSIRACLASPTAKQTWLAEVDAWLAAPDQAPGAQSDGPEAGDLKPRAVAR
ncbi:adenosine deaminase [Actinomyces oris]|uniref:adenosine deaminase n=1 Tax=Actinomyces oris TaxID=544580 RepID=UPI0022FD565C|nr:adenosine deaminase [Actinomyces oris]WCA43198.1 adenosine deaminase [Actinomyces oris]